MEEKKKIDIKITFNCNNHCKFCVQGDKRRFYPDKSNNETRAILRDSRDNYETVIFTGGEPTIRADIIELVAYAKNLRYRVEIQTNGRMFKYRDFCKMMVIAGVDVVCVSIHGHNAKLHDFLTEEKDSFIQSVTGIKNLLSFNRILVVTNTVINKLNYRFLPEIARFLINLGIPQYQFAFPHILGNASINQDEIVPRKKEVTPYVLEGIEIGIRKKKTVKIEAIPYCFLNGYESCVSDKDILDTKVFDGMRVTENFNRWRKEEGKLKGPNCRGCKYFQCCEGPWREYPEIFGWDEFVPVK